MGTTGDSSASNLSAAEFIATAAHDLRSPLQAISGFAELLERHNGAQLDQQGQEFLGWILQGVKSMEELIDRLVDSAPSETAALTIPPVAETAENPGSVPGLVNQDQAEAGALDLLLVEDSDAHARLVTALLDEASGVYRVRRAHSLVDARIALGSAPHCILLDLSLPDSEGLHTLAEIRTAAPHVPVVVLTSRNDEVIALEAVHQGAQDYLVKGNLDGETLSRSIRYAVERWTLKAGLTDQAMRDPLTGLANRTLLLDRLRLALSRRIGPDSRVAVLFLDIDRFKPINDRFGHEAGDLVFVEVARRLLEITRPLDTAGRMGGDEFVIVCEGLDGTAVVPNLVRRIQEAFDAPVALEHGNESVHVSIGWAIAEPGENAARVVSRADSAMYEIKRAGRS